MKLENVVVTSRYVVLTSHDYGNDSHHRGDEAEAQR